MSLFKKFFLLFYLLKSFTYSKLLDYENNLDKLCSNYSEKYNISNEKNFTKMVKMNFELFLCELYKNMFKNESFSEIYGGVQDIDLCLERIENSFENDSNFFSKYLSYSGSSIHKIGNENECIKNNLTYILIEMDSDLSTINKVLQVVLNETDYNSTNYEYQHLELNSFIENSKTYLGLCLWENCTYFYDKFFTDEKGILKYYIGARGYTAQSWTFYIHNKDKKSEYNYSMILSIILVTFIVFIRLFLCLSKYCTERNQSIESKQFKLNSLSPSPQEIQLYEQNLNLINKEEDLAPENSDTSDNNKKNDEKIIKEKNEQDDQYDDLNKIRYTYNSLSDSATKNSKCNSLIKARKTQADRFLEYYEYIEFDNLYKLETKSYNTKQLEAVCGLKFFLLFFISFYNVYNTFYTVKWNNPGSIKFYQDLLHIVLAKLSKTSFRIWIFFDGFQWCFKLLSYIYKSKIDHVSFKHILIFNINLIEKIIVFIIIFFVFIYQMKYLGDAFHLTSSFYKHIEKFTNVECFKNPLLILILPIIGYTEDIGQMQKCFNFMYILVNELYSIIICSIIFFLFFKLRSKIIEYLFLFLFFISILLLFVIVILYNKHIFKDDFHYYTKRYVLGEDFSLKTIPFLFNYFFIGCISGLVYYYSTLMNLNLEKYNIFGNFYNIMYRYIKINYVLRHIFGFFCLFLIFAICSYYPILFLLGILPSYRLIKEIGYLEYAIISYENIIQIFLFMFFFFDIILSTDTLTKSFLSNDIFILFERCSFIFLIISEPIVFLFETLMYLDGIFWTTENIFFLSIICFLITLFISIFLVFFIQLPVRLLTKKKEREYLDNYEIENNI